MRRAHPAIGTQPPDPSKLCPAQPATSRDTSEPGVGGRGGRVGPVARVRAVTIAVTRVAQVAAPPLHATVPGRRTGRIRPRRDAVVAGVKPVPAPFPDVAGHLVEAEPVGAVGPRGSGAPVTVRPGVPPREFALPDVHPVAPFWLQLVAPRVTVALAPAARRPLPLRLGRQPLARPRRVGAGVVPGDLHHWVIPAAPHGGARPLGMPPVGTLDPHPPLGAPHARPRRHLPRVEVAGEDEAPAKALRLGAVAGRVHEGVERLVGHGGRIEEERTQLDLVDRRLAVGGEAVIGFVAHPEDAARDQDHFRSRGPGHAPEGARRRPCVRAAAQAAAGWGSVLVHAPIQRLRRHGASALSRAGADRGRRPAPAAAAGGGSRRAPNALRADRQ